MDFVSWLTMKDGRVRFLTKKMIYETREGKALQRYCNVLNQMIPSFGNSYDHEAIRFYYEMGPNEGKREECTDFSSPANFPPAIAEAIKNNEMETRGVPFPDCLLNENCDYATDEEGWRLFENPMNRAENWK